MKQQIYRSGLLVGLLAGMVSVSLADIISSFDYGREDWTATNGTIKWMPSGGNPGGYLEVQDTGGTMYDVRLLAPSKFLGDLSSFDGGSLSFDSKLIDLGGGKLDNGAFGQVRLSSGSQTALRDLAPSAPTYSWLNYGLDLTPEAWGYGGSNWGAFLGNITEIRVTLDCTASRFETVGFDNFLLRNPAPPPGEDPPGEEPPGEDPPDHLPEPGTWLLVGIGTAALAWRRRRSH